MIFHFIIRFPFLLENLERFNFLTGSFLVTHLENLIHKFTHYRLMMKSFYLKLTFQLVYLKL